MSTLSANRQILDDIFFTDVDSVFQKGSEEHKDFWHFCEKYIQFQKRKKAKGEVSQSHSLPGNVQEQINQDSKHPMKLPDHYDKQSKINFILEPKRIYSKWKSIQDDSRRKKKSKGEGKESDQLTRKHLDEFKSIILYYLDFCQKQKLNKLLKLRQDQESLPIYQYKEQIIYALKTNQIVIVAGDTGCGKSTQMPQYLASAGFSNIACTQPRRIACISLAKRVGYETLNEYGSEVGYQVRFDSSRTEATKILFLTEGLLLRQFQSDPKLSRYNVIVVDEVHERHLNGDFLLGVLRCLLEQRQDLKLVLMSATINISLFANYFNGSPVLQIPGRLFPIELQYVPHFVEKSERTGQRERLDPSPYLRVMQLIDHKYPSSERGDLLIFMSGMAEIAAVVEAAREYADRSQKWIILPLHSSLSVEEQEKVFDIAPMGVRKCIVATNIAETSITIDGVRFICDSGKVKEMSFDPHVKMQRLQEFWISRASAEQRKGRAGRTGPGVCFRLYSDEDYQAFSEYSSPEIQRVPLDNLVLQMASLGLRDPGLFPFIEPPPKSSIEDAIYSLKAQKALLEDNTLTTMGKVLAKLPVDVVVGKMLVMGTLFDLLDPVMVIACALSVPSPLTRKLARESDVDVERRRSDLESKHGDPLTLLNMYDEWLNVKFDKKVSSRKWCKRRGYEEQRFYEMSKLKRQFEELLRDHALLKYEKVERDYMKRMDRRSEKEREKERLKDLKRAYRSAPRKRKMLKLESIDHEESEEEEEAKEEEGSIDIHDIEFRLSHDISKLKEKSNKRRDLTVKDMNLVKLIIASGLYPQIAVPDESNSWRKQSDQVYHSKSKQFLVLHPTSVYSTNPRLLTQDAFNDDQESTEKPSDDRFIEGEDLLIYVSLLETNKPYIVNPMKIPALQTLLLLCHSLDTDSSCTRIVCDEWLGVGLKTENEAQDLLSKVVQLRSALNDLLDLKLSFSEHSSVDVVASLRKTKRLQDALTSKLANFLSCHISYRLRRVMSAEVSYMYAGTTSNVSSGDEIADEHCDNPEESSKADAPYFLPVSEGSTHPTKGGVRVNEYLTYGCLRDSLSVAVAAGQAEYMRQHYHCDTCGAHLICTVVEKIQHMKDCHQDNSEQTEKHSDSQVIDADKNQGGDDESLDSHQSTSETSKLQRFRKNYFCEICGKNFQFSVTETLKHKQQHQKNQAS